MKRILQLSLWITILLVVLNPLLGALVGECDLCFANNVACISQQSFVLCKNGAPTDIEVQCPGDKICTSHKTICRSPTEDTPACYENYCGTCELTNGRFACIDETTYGFCFGELTPKLETFTKCPNGYVCNIEMGNCMSKETYAPSCYKSSEGTESTTSVTSTVTGVTETVTVTTNSVPTTIDPDSSTATITITTTTETTDPTATVITYPTTTVTTDFTTTDSTTTEKTDSTTSVTTDLTTTETTVSTTTVTDPTTTETTDPTTTVTTDPTTTVTTDSTTAFTATTGNGQSTAESSTVTSSVTADSSSTTVSDISTLTTDADTTTSIITTIASSTGSMLTTLTSMVSQITTTQMTTEIYSTPSTTTTRAPITNPDDFCNYIQAEGNFSLEGDTTCKVYIHCYNLSGDYIGTKYICAGYFNSVTQECQDEKPTNC